MMKCGRCGREQPEDKFVDIPIGGPICGFCVNAEPTMKVDIDSLIVVIAAQHGVFKTYKPTGDRRKDVEQCRNFLRHMAVEILK